MRGRPNPLQAAGRDSGRKLMEIKRLREKGHRITLLDEARFWRLVEGVADGAPTGAAAPAVRSLMPQRAADLLARTGSALRERFDDVTRRAAARFEARDWHGMHSDAVERLGLYRQTTDAALAELRRSHGPHLTDRALWPPLQAGVLRLHRRQGRPRCWPRRS